MTLQLWLPILVSAVALFFASFLSWMVLQWHRLDWLKLGREDDFLREIRPLDIPPGNYMFPGVQASAEMQSPEYQQKWEAGPRGVMTVFGQVSMGRNLALTFVYFLVVSFCLGYLATLALEPGAAFLPVFRFVTTAGLLAFLSAIVQHAIWFHCRIVGHVMESICYAAITGAIFAALWPAA
jgi:hypothetical protein